MSLNKSVATKILTVFSAFVLLTSFSSLIPSAKAAVGILPGGDAAVSGYVSAGDQTAADCSSAVDEWDSQYSVSGYSKMPTSLALTSGNLNGKTIALNEMLACGLKSGNMHFWMVPYFVNYALEFVINVAGILVVLMIVIGGYFYIYGAVSEDKDKGKTIITYAIGGYVLVLTSWFIVNALLLAVTQ